MLNLHEAFEAVNDDYLDFDKIENKLSQRADMHAFMMLDRLFPEGGDIISASKHDEFYLSIDCEKLAEVATPEMIRDLTRCGVRYESETDSLCMFS